MTSSQTKKGIELYTAGTPNGHKITIFLEELGLTYSPVFLELPKKTQKEEWFLKINPNGRIPAIIDHDNGDFALAESGAILIYLAEKYDKSNKFYPSDGNKRYEVLQWIMFQMSGIGPMMGQATVFNRYAAEKIQFGIDRYNNESERLFKVLEQQLEGREFICGEYSIADIATFPWVKGYEWSLGWTNIDAFPNIKRWLKTIAERPAVKKGVDVPPGKPKVESGRSILV